MDILWDVIKNFVIQLAGKVTITSYWGASLGILLFIFSVFLIKSSFIFTDSTTASNQSGGRGGNAKVVGVNSRAEGGTGGKSGIGSGGDGGNAEAIGNNSFARGGDGGNSGQWDGRGGRRTMSQGERMNLPTSEWPYGYGGAGANAPEYNRRLEILTRIRKDYLDAFPSDAVYIHAGIDQVPENWVNKRLDELKESWRVKVNGGGYILPPLSSSSGK